MFTTLAAKPRLDTRAEEFDPGKGLRLKTGSRFLNFLRSRSEETPCREWDCSAAEPEAAAEVDATVLQLMHSWNRHDARAWAECFTENADYVNLTGAHLRGRNEIEAKQAELHASMMRHGAMRVSEWSIRFLDAESCLVDMHWEMKGAAPRKRRGLLSMVLVPDGGRWRVTAGHNSGPLPVLS